jgi:dihydrodipicolinate synthase/N-acetylneuraminate lyase
MKPLPAVKIWSAVPTPLTPAFRVDEGAVERMVLDAVRNGIQGLFLAGTCGEGPWLPDREKQVLVRTAARVAHGKLKIAAQASDNSVPRILENVQLAAEAGADYAIIASPATFLNATPERVAALFTDAVNASPLPMGIYDLGSHRPVVIPEARLKEIYLLPNVHLVKDSSGAPARRAIALTAREAKPALQLFNGDEFRCLEYLQAGYDGFMFGGAVAIAPQLNRIAQLYAAGRMDEAAVVDAEMKDVLYGLYGGKAIACWLTGLKYYMVRRGLFATTTSFLGYPLTEECRAFVERYAATAT